MTHAPLSSGVWPAMITPLNPDRTIDWPALDPLIAWYLDEGVAGLFAVGLSSEMFSLNDDERLRLAKHVVERVNGRVPVVATGSFGDSLDEQADFIKRMADTGVWAVTIFFAALASPDEDSDDILKQRIEDLLAKTDDCPLALYECPQPYHRLSSPDLLGWAAQSGRFLLLKETSQSLSAIRDKVQATADTNLKILNADATTLLESLKIGGQGYCGIAANFYPRLLAWLCDHFASQPKKARHLQSVLGTFDVIIHQKYPLSAKYFLQKSGLDIKPITRLTTEPLDDYDRRVLDYVADTIQVHAEQWNLK